MAARAIILLTLIQQQNKHTSGHQTADDLWILYSQQNCEVQV